MKKILFAALIVALCASLAWAHSPSSISITITDGAVEVVISHPVSDPIEHYIKLVTVSVNGIEVERREFTTQSQEGQAATFEIPGLRTGDKVAVTAVCSRFGNKRQDVTVP